MKKHRTHRPAHLPPDASLRKIGKRRAFGRIIQVFVREGREYQLHATKGWRSYRAAH